MNLRRAAAARPKIPEVLYAKIASDLAICRQHPNSQSGMESARTTVISVGANPELVRLRNFVLQEAGFNVVSTLDEHDALTRIERGECGILLMCYSLAKPVRERLAETLRKFCPDSRIVAITNEHVDKPDFADTFVYGVEGPEALIEVVNAAVETSRNVEHEDHRASQRQSDDWRSDRSEGN